MTKEYDFKGLKALFINCTLKKSPEASNTQKLADISINIMKKNGVEVESIRAIDHDIAVGVQPDMTKHGWKTDEWPEIYQKKVKPADILVLVGPIWLGDNSSVMKVVIERLYAMSANLNDKGQSEFYGKAGGCLITGNEDGIKHCAMDVLYSLQHIGYTIPPQADAGWIGEAGPGASYGDKQNGGSRAGYDNDFTNQNTTIMSWNLMHLARLLKDNGGLPCEGNDRGAWADGQRFGFEKPKDS